MIESLIKAGKVYLNSSNCIISYGSGLSIRLLNVEINKIKERKNTTFLGTVISYYNYASP